VTDPRGFPRDAGFACSRFPAANTKTERALTSRALSVLEGLTVPNASPHAAAPRAEPLRRGPNRIRGLRPLSIPGGNTNASPHRPAGDTSRHFGGADGPQRFSTRGCAARGASASWAQSNTRASPAFDSRRHRIRQKARTSRAFCRMEGLTGIVPTAPPLAAAPRAEPLAAWAHPRVRFTLPIHAERGPDEPDRVLHLRG
jgi:hypothetical protein